MSEKNLKINEVKKESAENTRNIKLAQTTAGMSEAYITNYRKQLIKLKDIYELRKKDLESRLKRQIDNTKTSHDIIDALVANKEVIHAKLKAAIHLGEEQCEYCKNYYTPQGLSRHKTTCSMKPAKKIIKKHQEEIKEAKVDVEARRAALKKQLEQLG
ncbi:hypothetical protein LCGC14_1759640 [marine sediment metagenome]|uniref:Uncharacterized protein n=1 Tax=marine sediment metagenome TaxID=412755 RepID=A0A0F9JGJ8_9ZZZZ